MHDDFHRAIVQVGQGTQNAPHNLSFIRKGSEILRFDFDRLLDEIDFLGQKVLLKKPRFFRSQPLRWRGPREFVDNVYGIIMIASSIFKRYFYPTDG